ncbi:PTS transporter subunit EIIB [Schaalia odontolytica]|uniref:PTS system glucoside-specific EIICBA component n=1 Tax=Schaalia odontolytica TaxID=1660 RepID=A0A2X0VBQ4_9ACTO|nr:PTS transporter subunit EIIB [Schaalia odontolytica]WMS27561.1 PTS sugar transporter subunit IIBC [Schaalia odontolytica]SPT54917.1 PTS system glucoside-specific EIICBA component [Schaalia odontolytica]
MAIEEALIDALGGHLNIVEVEPCTMRIRIQVRSQRDVDEAALRVDGVLAVVRSGDVVQIVCGAQSDDVAAAMMGILDGVVHDTSADSLSQRVHA